MYFIAVLFPPLAVLLCGKPIQALLNCVLTLCLWIPGIIHACMVVSQYYADKNTARIERAILKSGRTQSLPG